MKTSTWIIIGIIILYFIVSQQIKLFINKKYLEMSKETIVFLEETVEHKDKIITVKNRTISAQNKIIDVLKIKLCNQGRTVDE
jgi:hypothetical protein